MDFRVKQTSERYVARFHLQSHYIEKQKICGTGRLMNFQRALHRELPTNGGLVTHVTFGHFTKRQENAKYREAQCTNQNMKFDRNTLKELISSCKLM